MCKTFLGVGVGVCRSGFALRELLVTMCCLSMIGMLGGVWVNQARNDARQNGCLSNIRQLALSLA